MGNVPSVPRFHDANRLTAVTSSLNDSQHPPTLYSVDASLGYYPTGGIRKASFGNGLTQTLAFNNRLQPCRINVNSTAAYFSHCTDATPSGNVVDFTVGYNSGSTDNGNVVSWSAAGSQVFSRSYVYDPLNRIQSMADTATGQPCQGMSWTIDAWSNMTNEAGTKGTCYSFSSAVANNNQLTSGYSYDAAGNMTFDGLHNLTYDAENRVTNVAGAAYVYNASGRRVRKNTGSYWTEYIYWPNGSVQSEWNGSSWPVQYVYVGSQLIAEYTNSTTEFVQADQLGSTRLVTAVNQSVVDSMDYLPYGWIIAGGSSTTHRFAGKEYDGESELNNFGARYYASTMGRFMTPDWAARPIAVPYALYGDPQSLNLYTYVRNDPVTRVDADGHDEPCPTENCGGGKSADPALKDGSGKKPSAQTVAQIVSYGRISESISFGTGNAGPNNQSSVTQSQTSSDPNYKSGVPHATGELKELLSCTQNCMGKQLMVTSTNEPLPNGKHGPGTPHGEGEAADLRVTKGEEGKVLQCAANCGAKFGLDERAHPSGPGVLPHVHIQTVPGTHGGRGDLPDPQE